MSKTPPKWPKWPFWTKISTLKLMLYETVRARNLKFGMNLPYIIVQLRMQYKNFSSYHLGAMGL